MLKVSRTHIAHGPLINHDTGVFRRGEYVDKDIESVAIGNPDYVLYLTEGATISDDDREFVEQFVEAHPDYFEVI